MERGARNADFSEKSKRLGSRSRKDLISVTAVSAPYFLEMTRLPMLETVQYLNDEFEGRDTNIYLGRERLGGEEKRD